MDNKKFSQENIVIAIAVILCFSWLLYGIKIFYLDFHSHFNPPGAGELGDFLGGGIGALTIIFVIYSLHLQIKQANHQQSDIQEAGVFRVFQALKPEVEGLSVRIYAKLQQAGVKMPESESFKDMRQIYWDHDRTIFLRALRKIDQNSINIALQSQEFRISLERFFKIMFLIENSIKDSSNDFKDAIKSTEVYNTFEYLRKKAPKDFNAKEISISNM